VIVIGAEFVNVAANDVALKHAKAAARRNILMENDPEDFNDFIPKSPLARLISMSRTTVRRSACQVN
jgi:hypothetical protein